jgi:hypothetical protein
LVIVLGARDTENQLEIASPGQLVCFKCELRLGAFSPFAAPLGNVYLKGGRGGLEVALKGYELGDASDSFLGGGSLAVEDLAPDRIRMKGMAKPVVLNGVVLSMSVWSYLSDQIKGGIVGALLAALMSLLLVRRRRPEK